MNNGDTEPKSFYNAIEEGDLEKAKSMHKRNPALISENKGGMTPLHWAAYWGHADVSAFLLTRQGEVNAQDNANGYRPLHVAAFHGHLDVAKVLLANNADVNAKDHSGWTPLRAAGRHTHVAELIRCHGGHD